MFGIRRQGRWRQSHLMTSWAHGEWVDKSTGFTRLFAMLVLHFLSSCRLRMNVKSVVANIARFGAQSLCMGSFTKSANRLVSVTWSFSCLVSRGRVGFLFVFVVGLPLVEGERSPTTPFSPNSCRTPSTLSTSLARYFRFFFVLGLGLCLRLTSAGLWSGPVFGRAAFSPCCSAACWFRLWPGGVGLWPAVSLFPSSGNLGFRGASTRGRLWLKCLRRT